MNQSHSVDIRGVPLHLVYLALGGIAISASFFILGIDITSPEVLKYAIIASPLSLGLLIASVVIRRNPTGLRGMWSCLFYSFLIWVPLETVVYAVDIWPVHRWHAFSLYNLPSFVLLLTVWSGLIGLLGFGIVTCARGGKVLLRRF